jgi:replicative DNA helicase
MNGRAPAEFAARPPAEQPRGLHLEAEEEKPKLYPSLGRLLDEFCSDVDEAHEAKKQGRPRGPITGFPSLDRELGGFLHKGLHVLHGNSSAGKTAFAWQIATWAKHPTLYVSCEMDALELLRRLVARATDTFLGKFSGDLDSADARRLAERAIATAPHTALLDATLGFADPEYLFEIVTDLKGTSPHFLLVIDSVHSWVDSNLESASEYDALNAGLTVLRKLGQRLNCPVLAIAERSRAAMKEGGINAMAGTRRFEYGSASVISLDRKGNGDQSGALPIEVTVDKNRHGRNGGKIKMHFHAAVQRFEEAPA